MRLSEHSYSVQGLRHEKLVYESMAKFNMRTDPVACGSCDELVYPSDSCALGGAQEQFKVQITSRLLTAHMKVLYLKAPFLHIFPFA